MTGPLADFTLLQLGRNEYFNLPHGEVALCSVALASWSFNRLGGDLHSSLSSAAASRNHGLFLLPALSGFQSTIKGHAIILGATGLWLAPWQWPGNRPSVMYVEWRAPFLTSGLSWAWRTLTHGAFCSFKVLSIMARGQCQLAGSLGPGLGDGSSPRPSACLPTIPSTWLPSLP